MGARKTKIIATAGPASLGKNVLKMLIKEGADIIRFNSAYGTKRQYKALTDEIKKENKRRKSKALLLFDLKPGKWEIFEGMAIPDIVAVSFVETASQAIKIRKMFPEGTMIISKIECKKGVKSFDKILDASDGIMVGRGDLGESVSLERLPCIQKMLTRKTIEKGKFLVIATEMLLSMVKSPTPTRAEVSDVGNAVFDNASAVMLSEETAIGKYPIEAVRVMRSVVESSETCPFRGGENK
jgi:pyruvate kinase